MKFWETRMGSYVDRGNVLIDEGKVPEAMKMVEKGLQYYSEKIINALWPYAKSDAGLIVLVLRHLADEIERSNPGARELATGLGEIIKKPTLVEKEKVKKVNRR